MKVRKHVSSDTPQATGILGEFLGSVRFSDIPQDVVVHAQKMIMDTVGVSLGAVGSAPVEAGRSALEPPTQTRLPPDRGATIMGYGETTSVRDAAFYNGMLANALDFDDHHPRMGGHPSSPILPVVLALGETHELSGEQIIAAFVAGIEVEIALGAILNPGHYERGWHPTAVLGHMGAAAAAGVALGLSVSEFQTAFGIATSQAGGSKANLGSMTKPYHVGNAARSGIEAAQLAAGSFMAHSTAIENEFGGFCELFKGENGYAYSDHLDRLGHHWALLNPPVGFKPYPCCASSHAAIDCALALRNTHAIDPSTIESVTIRAHPRRLQHTDDPTPSSGLAGKISVQYAVTRALIRGDVWIDDFTAEAFDSTIRGTVLEKIHVERAPELFETDRWGAHITLTTDTHDTYEHRVDGPRGSQINPLTPSELREKFTRCAANVLSEEAIHHALETLSEIPRQSDVRPTIESISPPQ